MSRVVEKKCKICSLKFKSFISAKRKYCGLKCAYKDSDRSINTIKACSNKISIICKQCRKTRIYPASRRKNTKNINIFCSKKCWSLSCKIQRICKECKKIFYKRKSEIRIAPCNFCSNLCKNKWIMNNILHTPEVTLKSTKTRRMNGSYNAIAQYSNSRKGKRADLKNTYFRSSWEANAARILNLQKRNWLYETKTFWFENIKRGCRSYTPDFYLPNENIFIEVKGWWDQKSKTKMKRMKKYYPNIVIEIWDKDFFQATKKQGIDKLIKNWEY